MCITSAWVFLVQTRRCQAIVAGHGHPLKCNFQPTRKPVRSIGTLRATGLDVNSTSDEINTAVSSTLELNSSVDAFNWYKQWYPVAILADLDKTKPTAVKVLDTDIVIWWSPSRSWNVFLDRCPHRLAALSEGRIDSRTGQLECGYHGWQFAPSGKCTVIPQADDGGRSFPPVAACAKALPSCVEGPLLFAWLGKGKPLPGSTAPVITDDRRARHIVSTFARTLPVPFTILLQNVLDPAHIHFAHHGQIGRRELADALPIRMLSDVTKDGFSADYYDGRVKVRFRPPGLVEIVSADGQAFGYYAVPVTKNVTRTFAVSGSAYWPVLQRVRPAWVDHLRRNVILEADLGLLQSQTGMPWRDYFLPTSCDKLVRALGMWLDAYGYNDQAKQWCAESGGDGEIGKEVLLRTQGHTEECGRCRTVVKRIDATINIAYALGMICIVLDAFQVSIVPVDRDVWRHVWVVCAVSVLLGTRWKKVF